MLQMLRSAKLKRSQLCSHPSSSGSVKESPLVISVCEGTPASSLLERIEAELLEAETIQRSQSAVREVIVLCLPKETMIDENLEGELDSSEQFASSCQSEEGIEMPASLFEQITATFLETCACTPSGPKSALRSSSRGPTSAAAELRKSVSFDKVNIHEFKMTLGHHPSAVSGPPIALDWDHKARVRSLPLENYEKSKAQSRRSRKELKLTFKDRQEILQSHGGFSETDVYEAWAEALKVRQQRRETLQRGPMMMIFDDIMESANRKYRRLTESLMGCATTF